MADVFDGTKIQTARRYEFNGLKVKYGDDYRTFSLHVNKLCVC